MTNYKYLRGASISDPSRVIFDIPDAPTIGTATDVGTSRAYNNGAATVTITSQAVTGGPTTGYTVTSSPDGFTGSGTSPITVTGLQTGTSYTFTAKATNTSGSSPATTATSSITATTVPQSPTIGTPTNAIGQAYTGTASVSVPFTTGATGGKSITGYSITSSSGATATGASSPISVTESNLGTAATYTVTATNANGTSVASTASSSVTPSTVPQAPTIGTFTDGGTGTTGTLSFTANATGGSSITNYKVSTDNATYTALSPSQTSSPLSLTGLSAGTANYYIKAVNSNGDSAASSGVSGTVALPSGFYSIATQSVGSGGASSVTFSSIPSTYNHLQIRGISQSSADVYIRYNGDSGTNYSQHIMQGDGSATSANGFTNSTYSRIANSNPYQFAGIYLDILDYSNTNKYKTNRSFFGIDGNGSGVVGIWSGSWRNTAAVTSITISGTFSQYSSFALYGVK